MGPKAHIPLGFAPSPSLRRMGLSGAGSLGPCRPRNTPYSPCGPPGLVAPLGGPRDPPGGPGTLPINPEALPVTKIGLPIYKSLPPDHSGTPRDVRDLIRDSEQLSG